MDPARTTDGSAADRSPLLTILLLGVTAGISVGDVSITNTALVEASSDLGMSASMQALAASTASLALAASVIPTGFLADRAGRRRVLVGAAILVIVGDIVTALSPVAAVFLAGRAISGVALGIAFSASFAYVRTVAGDARVGRALGRFTAAYWGVAAILAFAGGALATVGWRLAYVVVPLAALLWLLVAPRRLPAVPREVGRPVDGAGIVVLATAMVVLLLGLSAVSTRADQAITWILVGAGIVGLGVFVAVEHRVAAPLIPPRLFRDPVFIGAALAGIAFGFAFSVAGLQVANLWQYVDRLDTLVVSLGQLPISLAAMVGALVAGAVLSRGTAPRTLMTGGMGMIVVALLLLAALPERAAFWLFVPGLIGIGLGSTIVLTPQGQLFLEHAPPESYGSVTSSRLSFSQLGNSMGLAGGTALISVLTVGGVTRQLVAAGVPPSQTGEAIGEVLQFVRTGAHPSTSVAQEALADAAASYSQAFDLTLVIVAALIALVGAACWRLLRPHRA